MAWNEEGETLSLARKHLSNNGYSLALNNCEHFAAYCATGKKKSKQVRKAVGGLIGITLAIIFDLFHSIIHFHPKIWISGFAYFTRLSP